MRATCVVLLTGWWLLAAGCASVSPEQAERDALILEAARGCEGRARTVRILGVDQYGRLRAEYQSPADWRIFSECYQAELQRRLKARSLGAGRFALPSSGARQMSAPIQLAGSSALVGAAVNGSPVTLLVDTGASMTILSPRAMARLGITVPVTAPKILTTVVGGGTLAMPYVRVSSLRVGEFTVEDIDVGVYDALPQAPAVDGLLGANFLNHFKVTLDRDQRHLTLEASREAAAPAPPPAAAGRVWEAPTWTPGDEWSFRWESPSGTGTLVRTVDRDEEIDGVAHYVVRSGSRRTYLVKANLGIRLERVGDDVVVRLTPPLGHAWPLQVGKAWESSYSREDPRAQQTQKAYRKCEAVGEDTVVVPAGSFVALHVVCRNRAGRVIFESWYASEPKHWVRERVLQTSGLRTQDLVSYTLRAP